MKQAIYECDCIIPLFYYYVNLGMPSSLNSCSKLDRVIELTDERSFISSILCLSILSSICLEYLFLGYSLKKILWSVSEKQSSKDLRLPLAGVNTQLELF